MVEVMTVTGPLAASELGRTLIHEHLVVDATAGHWTPPEPWKQRYRDAKVTPDIAWVLREDPFCCLDNCTLDDVDGVVDELGHFLAAGGRSVVDATCEGMGRDPAALVEISRRTGLNIVMGAGWYLSKTHPDWVKDASIDQLTEHLLHDFEQGPDDTGVRPGLIGEIGVSAAFTRGEERCLRAAARAQVATGVPLMVHLPGWQRPGHRVLDIANEEGVRSEAVVLCHINPSDGDPDYQASLAARGAWLEFDMVGMGFYYADQDGQSPSADDDATAIARLVDAGYARQVLLSHDVFLKNMWTRYGGNGFGYVPLLFLDRLVRHGIPRPVAEAMIDQHPTTVFEAAAANRHAKERP
jgi:phosphotriesterase-related protein